ncbi:DUF1735 domain-containing protein [Polaribacter sp. MSW13]|uniref:DUF1735 domain-containing protein n=1 Tax=Polaribacter marinus TaxID=2916838 RepID=A0A9X2AK75_9FLAO|nr:DUF1735 domain-containing protein [Polaribacter marinus]MCI2229782.1 DUF1735 domain-containing protein [Polaribacter marinus]
MKKNIYLFLLSIALISFSSCEESGVEALGNSVASFEATTLDIGVEIGSSTTKDINVYTSNISGTDRTIEVMVDNNTTDADAAAYTVPASVTIPAGTNVGTITIGVNDVDLAVDKTLVIRLKSTENLDVVNKLTIGLSQLCPNNGIKIKLDIAFDSWPEEIAWRILDSNGTTVMASASNPFNYGAYAGMTGGVTVRECLASGTYTIEVYDGYGDGGNDYTVTANGILVFSATGNYGAFVTEDFTI